MIAGLSALPLVPDGDEARSWAEQELANPIYEVAEPTPFDRFAKGVADVIESLFTGGIPAALGPWLAVAAIAIVAAVVVVALLIWGRPRAAARSRRTVPLFGDTDERSAAQLRADSSRAAADGSWEEAVALRFRALARALVERTVVDPAPGATVHGFAREAARAFPTERDALNRAAGLFDDVRYLRRPGTPVAYDEIARLDDRLTAIRPADAAPAARTDAGVLS